MGTLKDRAVNGAELRSSLLIRAARAEDLDTVLGLLREASLPEAGVTESFGSFMIATRGDQVVGSCGLERYGEDGLMRSVVVAPELQRSGVGRALTEYALSRAREQRLTKVYLLTTTARSYFETLGFQVVPREQAPAGIRGSWEFSNGCPSSATFMARSP